MNIYDLLSGKSDEKIDKEYKQMLYEKEWYPDEGSVIGPFIPGSAAGVGTNLPAGGTDGQYLAKNTDKPYEAEWRDLPDIPEIPAYLLDITPQDIINWNNKQDQLVSGVNVKTVNGESILGTGNIISLPPELYQDSPGENYEEMLRNKLDYCISNVDASKEYTMFFINGGWYGKNYGFGIYSKIAHIHQLVWHSPWGTYFCRKSGDTYTYRRAGDYTYVTRHNPASSGNYLALLEYTEGEQVVHTSPGFSVYNANGTNGRSEISLGTNVASGTDGARDGVLRLFSKGTGSNYIANQANHNSTYWHELPQVSGTFLMKEQLLNLIYPVGSIYISVRDTSPQTFLGGTWERLQDRFLLGASSTYAVNTQGGSKDAVIVAHTHGLSGTATSNGAHTHTTSGTAASAGSHSHAAYGGANVTSSGGSEGLESYGSRYSSFRKIEQGTYAAGAHTHSVTGTAASNGAHTHTLSGSATSTGVSGTNANMPPYLAVYMWKRTA